MLPELLPWLIISPNSSGFLCTQSTLNPQCFNTFCKQECIPVGCVPSTAVVFWGGGLPGGMSGVSARGVSAQGSEGVYLGRGCLAREFGRCLPRVAGKGCLPSRSVCPGGCLPVGIGCLPRETGGVCHPPREQNHRCL